MFTTLRKADDVRKDTNNCRYLFERIEKSGLPRLISEASNRGEYSVSFNYAKADWDRNFTTRVVGTLRDFGYTVNDPKTVTTIDVSWEDTTGAKEDDDEYT